MATTKLTLAAALFVALVAVATATSYTTTVTTTTTTFEDEADHHEQQQQCQRQLKGRYFRSCQRYLAQKSGPHTEDKEVIENPGQQQPHHLEECCQQLQNVNEQCRCEAIKSAMKQMQQQMGQTTQQVYDRAAELPRKCNMRPQQCQIRVVFV